MLCPCNVFLWEAVWWMGTGAVAIVALAVLMVHK
jgi:hypothetical protein